MARRRTTDTASFASASSSSCPSSRCLRRNRSRRQSAMPSRSARRSDADRGRIDARAAVSGDARSTATFSVFRPGLLDGQVAIVTGGGTGIGFGIAELLSELGATTVLASRRLERLEPAVQRLRDAGGRAAAVQVDVRDPERVRAMVEQVRTEQGRIDVLVNNAAGNFYAPSETMSANAWRSVVEIDLFGTFYCSQAVMPVMREQG